MNHKLTASNFGPIKEATVTASKYMVLIGPQASGKSTLGKLFYFFRSLQTEVEQVLADRQDEDYGVSFQALQKAISKKFYLYFGASTHKTYTIKYEYALGNSIEIAPKDQFAQVTFSQGFKDGLVGLFKLTPQLVEAQKRYDVKVADSLFTESFEAQELKKQVEQARQSVLEGVDGLLGEAPRRYNYVPAARSVIGTFLSAGITVETDALSGEDELSNERNTALRLDYFTHQFLSLINKVIQPAFSDKRDLSKALEDRGINPENTPWKEVLQLMRLVLKGEFRMYKREQSRFFFEGEDTYNQSVLLHHASSGQQEAVYVLYTLLIVLMDGKPRSLVFEEPEAHLFPEAQKHVVEAIALTARQTNSHFIVTTHSPYILSAFNNLIFAHKTGQTHATETEEAVPSLLWLAKDDFQAFYVENGGVRDIMSSDFDMMHNEAIDQVSEELNNTFDHLLQLDLDNE